MKRRLGTTTSLTELHAGTRAGRSSGSSACLTQLFSKSAALRAFSCGSGRFLSANVADRFGLRAWASGGAARFPYAGSAALEFDLVHCPLSSGSLDAVVLLNVLEHIEDHAAVVRQRYRISSPAA